MGFHEQVVDIGCSEYANCQWQLSEHGTLRCHIFHWQWLLFAPRKHSDKMEIPILSDETAASDQMIIF